MIVNIRLVLTIGFLLAQFGCTADSVKYTTCSSCNPPVSDQPLEELMKKAKDGDADSAYEVAQYLDYVMKDVEGAIYWSRLAAQHGNPKHQFELAYFLRKDGPTYNCSEAKYWLERASEQGYEPATLALSIARRQCPD